MRYAIDGQRPGTTFFVGGRVLATSPVDGGAYLTQPQIDELTKRGYTLRKVGVEPPREIEPESPEYRAEIKKVEQAAEKVGAEAFRPLRKRTHKP